MAANDTIEPLMAVHRIGYGDKKEALPGTPFTPTSAEDRVDLINLGAARELTDAERNVFAPKAKGPKAKASAEELAAAEAAAAEARRVDEEAAAEAAAQAAAEAAAQADAEAAANAGTGTENLLG